MRSNCPRAQRQSYGNDWVMSVDWWGKKEVFSLLFYHQAAMVKHWKGFEYVPYPLHIPLLLVLLLFISHTQTHKNPTQLTWTRPNNEEIHEDAPRVRPNVPTAPRWGHCWLETMWSTTLKTSIRGIAQHSAHDIWSTRPSFVKASTINRGKGGKD